MPQSQFQPPLPLPQSPLLPPDHHQQPPLVLSQSIHPVFKLSNLPAHLSTTTPPTPTHRTASQEEVEEVEVDVEVSLVEVLPQGLQLVEDLYRLVKIG